MVWVHVDFLWLSKKQVKTSKSRFTCFIFNLILMANCLIYPLVFDVFVLGFIIIDGG